MAWTSPRTWVAGEIPTAANFNTHLRDNMKAIGDTWTAYTPAWTGGVNPAIGNGTIVGAYSQAGKHVTFWIHVTMGTTTTYGSGGWFLSLPVLQVVTPRWSFPGLVRDTSATNTYPIVGEQESVSLIRVGAHATTAGNQLRALSGTVPFAWATGDTISIHGTYEAA